MNMKIIKCTCVSKSPNDGAAYQNKTYGEGKRAHNPFKNGSNTGYRCTVCNSPKTSEPEKIK